MFKYRGVNYFPSQHGWWRMWVDWDPAAIDRELDLARTLGANTLRTALPFSLFEWDAQLKNAQVPGLHLTGPESQDLADLKNACSTPNPIITLDVLLQRVEEFLGKADARGMRVIMRLLNEEPYLHWQITNFEIVRPYLAQILSRFGADRRIAAWDLVNELDDFDPDQHRGKIVRAGADAGQPLFVQPIFDGHTDPLAGRPGLGWLETVYRFVQQHSANITIGPINPYTSRWLLNHFPDHIPQYHEYPQDAEHERVTGVLSLQKYAEKVDERMQLVWEAHGQAVLIGEAGFPSKHQKYGVQWTPDLQQQALELVLQRAQEHARTGKVLGLLIWTLTDWGKFAPDDGNNDEKYRGLYTEDGGIKGSTQPSIVDRVTTIFHS